MQYFATVIPEDATDQVNEDTILWLTKDKIEDMANDKRITDDLPELVGKIDFYVKLKKIREITRRFYR